MSDPGDLILSLTKDDFVVRTFRVSGNGGQKVNKTSSGVEITHPASGAVGRSTDTRSQHQNRHIALERLAATPTFKAWLAATTRGMKTPKEIEQEVLSDIADPRVTITEVWRGKKEGWVRVEENDLV